MSSLTSPRTSSAPARRRTLAALALAVGLALSACGGDDDEAAPREAYQPGAASESADPTGSASPSASATPTAEASSAAPTSEPASEAPQKTEEPREQKPSEAPEPKPSAAPAQEECVGSDYNFTDLSGDIGCYDAKVAVEKVLNTGSPLGGGVADNNVKCTPEGSSWTCAQLGDTVYSVTVQAKNPAKDPLQDILDSSSSEDSETAEPAAITCSGAAYEFTDVRGMDCATALAVLDPFADRRVAEGRSGADQCYMEKQGGREHWSCSRDSGGSFSAVSR